MSSLRCCLTPALRSTILLQISKEFPLSFASFLKVSSIALSTAHSKSGMSECTHHKAPLSIKSIALRCVCSRFIANI